MIYRDYVSARDLAWELLIRYEVRRLPVRMAEICRGEGLRLITYKSGADLIDRFALAESCAGNDGFLFKRTIFYDGTTTLSRQRFVVAHELGHFLLGHEGRLINREPSDNDLPVEQQASAFAFRLLTPACVLHELSAYDAERIAALCDISPESARYRSERMRQLKKRDRFGTSPLERQVLEQFEGYIKEKSLSRS